MRPLTARERQMIAVLILVAVIALAMALVVGPVLSGFSRRAEQREQLAATFHANERRIAALPALQHEAEQQAVAIQGLFLTAPDADQAGEALRERIEAAAEGMKVEVRSSEAMSGSDDGWAHAALEVRLDHAAMARLLARLGELQPAISIDGLTVIADDAITSYKLDLLNVRIEASAPFLPAR